MNCTVPGCNRAISRKKYGWCEMHYMRWRRHGDLTTVLQPRGEPGRLCSLNGCEKPHFGHGYCAMHHARWRKHGDPHGGHYHRDGANNTVITPGYGTMHCRLRQLKTGRCSTPDCSRTTTEMALLHGRGHLSETQGEYILRYSNRTEDYVELCVRCHRLYDENPIALRTA